MKVEFRVYGEMTLFEVEGEYHHSPEVSPCYHHGGLPSEEVFEIERIGIIGNGGVRWLFGNEYYRYRDNGDFYEACLEECRHPAYRGD